MTEKEKETQLLKRWALAVEGVKWNDVVERHTEFCLMRAKKWASLVGNNNTLDTLLLKTESFDGVL